MRIPAQGGNVVKHFRVDKAPSVVKVRLVNALAKSGHWSAELPVPAPIGIKLRKGQGEKDKRDTDSGGRCAFGKERRLQLAIGEKYVLEVTPPCNEVEAVEMEFVLTEAIATGAREVELASTARRGR